MIMSECHRSQDREAEGVVGDARWQWEASTQTDMYSNEAPDFPSGSLQEGSEHRRPSCSRVTLPSLPPEHSQVPEGLIKSGPRPLTSHFPEPEDTAQRPIKPANDAGPEWSNLSSRSAEGCILC